MSLQETKSKYPYYQLIFLIFNIPIYFWFRQKELIFVVSLYKRLSLETLYLVCRQYTNLLYFDLYFNTAYVAYTKKIIKKIYKNVLSIQKLL